ncbi:MAG: hypothetical protein JOZ75_07505 [Candidatus Dormibacteraeota bacterium]|nr:hypothetical protein [Candidatus Dormibacteraeota bacterium]
MNDVVLVVTSAVTALGASAAALFAGLAIRAQDRAQRRQQALENFRWLHSSWDALRPQRGRAARSLLAKKESVTDVREVLNFFETVAYLVRSQFLDLDIAENVLAASTLGWWSAGQSVVAAGRAEYGPGIFEHLEWMHRQIHGVAPQREGWEERFLQREAAAHREAPAGAAT